MLVLGRKENQRLIIDGNIVITVVRVAGGNVRLGIEAPAEVSIQRVEIVEARRTSHDRSLTARVA